MKSDANRLVIFDCDGTLVDSQHLIVAAMTTAFESLDRAPPTAEAVRRVVGLSLGEAVAALAPGEQRTDVGRLVAAYRRAFMALREKPHDEPLFAGAREALVALDEAGYLLGLATGKSLAGLKTTLGRHGLERYFVTLQTGDRAPGKPDPEMVRRAMAEAGAEAPGTVVVGDTTYDIEMALNAGVGAVGVSWGYHAPAELVRVGARRVLDDFAQLEETIAELLDGGGSAGAEA